MLKRVVSVLLAFVFVAGGIAAAVFAEGGTDPCTDGLPARYDGREIGYIPTHTVDQGHVGACWIRSSLLAIECYMVKNGVIDAATGLPATTDVDLSDYHVGWFIYDKGYDKLGLLSGDETFLFNDDPILMTYNRLYPGGNSEIVALLMMRWEGPAPESVPALSLGNITLEGIDPEYAWAYDSAHLQNTEMIPTRRAEEVKRAITEYGAGALNLYFDTPYYDPVTFAYYNPDADNTNHFVTVVGWDDDYPAETFGACGRIPEKNGAWICRNTWGEEWGEDGYFYVSYEDLASLSGSTTFFTTEPVDNYDSIYQYDGTISRIVWESAWPVANTFT